MMKTRSVISPSRAQRTNTRRRRDVSAYDSPRGRGCGFRSGQVRSAPRACAWTNSTRDPSPWLTEADAGAGYIARPRTPLMTIFEYMTRIQRLEQTRPYPPSEYDVNSSSKAPDRRRHGPEFAARASTVPGAVHASRLDSAGVLEPS